MFKLVTICGKEFTWWIILRANHENITYKSTRPSRPHKPTKLLLIQKKSILICSSDFLDKSLTLVLVILPLFLIFFLQ